MHLPPSSLTKFRTSDKLCLHAVKTNSISMTQFNPINCINVGGKCATSEIHLLLPWYSPYRRWMNNYRPISNFPFFSKIIEMGCFSTAWHPLGPKQHHSSETALVKFLKIIHLNTDRWRASAFVLLHLSAAISMVDHNILVDGLENWVGLSGTMLN